MGAGELSGLKVRLDRGGRDAKGTAINSCVSSGLVVYRLDPAPPCGEFGSHTAANIFWTEGVYAKKHTNMRSVWVTTAPSLPGGGT